MTEPSKQDNTPEPAPVVGDLLDLDFAPGWARKPPTHNVQQVEAGHEPASAPAPRSKPPVRSRGTDQRRSPIPKGGKAMASRHTAITRTDPDLAERVAARILPAQKQLITVAHQIRTSHRAHSIRDLAELFVGNPQWCVVRLEARSGEHPIRFQQCRKCGMPALDRDGIVTHLLHAHLDDYFSKEETMGEAPDGTFVCVAVCGLSGEVLGPPNHHTYNDRVEEIRRMRFPNLSAEEYRNSIRMVRDPELIAKWKEESRRKVLYRRKTDGVNSKEALKWVEAAAAFVREFAPSLISTSARVVFSATILSDLKDPVLRRVTDEAWNREKRFPRSIIYALQAAFTHLRLYRFRGPAGAEFVTAIQPQPLNKEHVVELIRAMLTKLEARSPMSRADLFKEVLPGVGPESAEAKEFWTTLSWLLERGHVIEYADGTLGAPPSSSPWGANPSRVPPAVKKM